MSTRRGSPTAVASSVPFDNVGNKINATEVQSALSELRKEDVLSIIPVVTSLNGNYNILKDNSNIHAVEGSATGFTITLPDATTLFLGRRFEILNKSSESIEVLDNDGTLLTTLINGDIGVVTLESNPDPAGTWIVSIISSSAKGITSFSIGSSTTFTTTSATDVLVTGMSVTPDTGRYGLWFSADTEIAQNNKLAEVVIYINGSVVERTRRVVQGVSSNFKSALITIAEVSVNGSEQLDVRVNISGGSLDVNQRRLLLIRLGN